MKWTPILLALVISSGCLRPDAPSNKADLGSEADDTEATNESEASLSATQGAVSFDPVLPMWAGGNEPGWTVRVEETKITVYWDYGQHKAITGAPVRSDIESGVSFTASTDSFSVVTNVADKICADDATGMPHPYRVSVSVTGLVNADLSRELVGCGGSPKSLLTGEEWVVEDINGRGIVDASRVSIAFADEGTVTGLASCNSYNGSFELTGEQLTVGTLASTRKACAPALMTQETEFLRILQDAAGFEIDRTGALVIRSLAGRTLLARR